MTGKKGDCKGDIPKRGYWVQSRSDPLNCVITVVSFPPLQKCLVLGILSRQQLRLHVYSSA